MGSAYILTDGRFQHILLAGYLVTIGGCVYFYSTSIFIHQDQSMIVYAVVVSQTTHPLNYIDHINLIIISQL